MNALELYTAELTRCAEWIKAALPYCNGAYEWDDIVNACLTGRMQLWPGEKSALVTEIVQYPRRKYCVVSFAGGDLEELEQMSHRIRAYARSLGCDHMAVHGRKGWARALGVGRIVSTTAVEAL